MLVDPLFNVYYLTDTEPLYHSDMYSLVSLFFLVSIHYIFLVIFECYRPLFLMGQVFEMRIKIILTSEWCAKPRFAGQKTQHF